MLPTLRQLHYLKLLVEHGSFSRAAEAAHVTQPTISAGINELEKILGANVVDRGRSGLILTPVGREVARRAEEILAQVDDLVQAAGRSGRPLVGTFRLGVIPTIAPFLLPQVLPRLRRRYPQLRLVLREDLTTRLVAMLKAGTIDAALIALPANITGLDHAEVSSDELVAAVPAGHRLAEMTRIPQGAMDGENLILLEDGHCLREHALSACGLQAAPQADDAETTVATTSLHTTLQMVGWGLGITLLPGMAVEAGLTRLAPVVVRPLEHAPCRKVVVVWRAGSSREVEGRLLAETLRTPEPAVA
ncbi:transcriptional regulator, LysR family [Faunimonas pinastri]|uniref:Transcriptional regulator, LysR family n=1 Tax=Faunimonas pinastri TaxID=1855383 RepID=A0A1H9LY31_9HYPH|nr:hydrogen peroxide-inducible genes activator [Faunimonas pinastri]SER16341.1 transcriptional regulator, LysR family [Faunimonas pinastri]